jgi:hypothetical protein
MATKISHERAHSWWFPRDVWVIICSEMAITSSRPDCRITYQLGTKRVHPLQKEEAKCWYSRTKKMYWFGFGFMVSNATFNTISVISWRSVLLVKGTGVPGENDLSQVTHKLYHITLFRVHLRVRTKKCPIGKLKSEGYQIWFSIFHLYIQDEYFCISRMLNFK